MSTISKKIFESILKNPNGIVFFNDMSNDFKISIINVDAGASHSEKVARFNFYLEFSQKPIKTRGKRKQSNKAASKKEMVDHPDHYNSLGAKTPCGVHIECIDVIEHMPSNLASAVKYCWRKDHKNAPIQDLEKARWYIDREIDRLKRSENG